LKIFPTVRLLKYQNQQRPIKLESVKQEVLAKISINQSKGTNANSMGKKLKKGSNLILLGFSIQTKKIVN
tara:strand:- start:117 stop:326 length:210 start_codon:yes stop_codon:yes gene_type:complete